MLKQSGFKLLVLALPLAFAVHTPRAQAQAEAAPLNIAQTPLFLRQPEAPLNMLVVGRDHKLFYEAYNDASDLNEDGIVDVGYKPATVTYYGNFDSNLCYTYASGMFSPSATSSNKKCSGAWSGDFLNYLTSARIDALRKVLYGGKRVVDTVTQTVIERAHVPQDGHSWGKEYESILNDGYDIREYAPLALPAAGTRHLFGSVNLGNTNTPTDPLLRVLINSRFRVWNWASIEGPVLGDQCVTSGNNRVSCETAATGASVTIVEPSYFPNGLVQTFYTRRNDPNNANAATATADPGRSHHPGNATQYELFMARVAVADKRCGQRTVPNIDGSGNPFTANASNGATCTNDYYATVMTGQINNPGPGVMRVYIDGDDAVQLKVNGTVCTGYYGGHGEGGGTTYFCDLPVGLSNLTFWHEEVDGGDGWRLRRQIPGLPASTRTDYVVRTEVCKAGFPEAHCRTYPRNSLTPTSTKPTGLLHDYGEDETMMFGLLTGSYRNNTQGGILRKAMSSFANEVNPATGIFTANASIVQTLDRFRVVGFVGNSYGGDDGKCPGMGRLITTNECYSWGNPLAEMMLESMRYFSGATTATPAFVNNVTGLTRNWDNLLNLPEVTWGTNTDPYRPRASGGFSVCAKPFQTLISDINPSYDTDLLSSPVTINGQSLNAISLGDEIWSHEFGGARNIYIGESGTLNDGAPTAKLASSFGNIRGLSPEEPTKKGGYLSASLALWGLRNDVSPAVSTQNIKTFSVALASPLPRIELPVRDQMITLIPFGKTVSGTFGGNPFKPTNTIVDFYVEAIGNFPGAPSVPLANNGKGFARFRINYEDVEQGNDHDMDSIILYDLRVVANGTTGLDELVVTLTSEYAAGSANQNLGYVISGTTADGVYLEVRDSDSAQATSAYLLNTPAGVGPGGCAVATPPAACAAGLTLNSTRTFVPGADAPATLLKDPLWFAAKYGGFDDSGAAPNGLPDAGEWDRKGPLGNTPDGNPDNYFLVTNALKLKDQLKDAFQQILEVSRPQGRLATNSTRINGRTLLFQAEYDSRDWTGDVRAYQFNETTLAPGAEVWNASSKLTSSTVRKIFTFNPDAGTGGQGVTFELANLSNTQKAHLHLSSDAIRTEMIAYLRGNQTREQAVGGPYRNRSKLIGDIANSGPQVMSRESFGYDLLPDERASYTAYLATKEGRGDFVFVGANDGMLHAFDGSNTINGGREVFAFIPNAVFPNLSKLLDPAYEHHYYVDGTPTIGDAKFGGGWKTVLVGTLGAGGRSVYALDITSPTTFDASKVLWEFTDPDLGFGIGQAKIARLADGRFAAIFGNGYNSTNHRSVLFVVNLETGALIRKITTNTGTAADANGLGSPTAIDASGLAKARANRSAPLVPYADSDPTFSFDQRADTVFAGDLHGNLWKFDISSANAAAWGFARLFNAVDASNRRQRITAAPQVAAHPLGGVLVLFGSGRYFVKGDSEYSAADAVNSFYGIWDPGSLTLTTGASPITRTLLQPRVVGTNTSVTGLGNVRTVSGDAFIWGEKFGYVLDFAEPHALLGERVLAQPLIRFGLVFFNTFAPNVNLTDNCEPGGRGFLMSLSAFGGLPAITLPSGAACPGCAGIERGSDSPPGEPTLLTGDGVLVDIPPNFADGSGTAPTSRLIGRPYGQLSWRQLK